MNHRSLAIFALAILAIQPLVVFSTIGITTSSTDIRTQHDSVLSQSPGTRLTPQQHTDHVPIHIDGDNDFVLQGWPGAGTAGSPYVISALNITYDAGTELISIANVNSYFVIRDCYLQQQSMRWAVSLVNVTNAKLEYITIADSPSGIIFNNVTDSSISHVDISAQIMDSILIMNSLDVSVQSNALSVGDLYISSSMGISASENLVQDAYNAVYVHQSNGTSITSNTINGATHYGVQLDNSSFCDILGNYINETSVTAVYLRLSENTTIWNNNIINTGARGIDYASYKWISIKNNYINGTGDFPIYTDTSSNGEIINNVVADSPSYGGIVFEISGVNFTVSDNYCDNVFVGIGALGGSNIDVYRNTVIDVTNGFTYFNGVTDLDIANNIGRDSGTHGLYLISAQRANVYGNTLNSSALSGIYIDGLNSTIENNIVYDATIGVNIQPASGNAQVSDNHIATVSQGILVAADNAQISSNTITDATMGVQITGAADNAKILNNVIDSVTTAISLANTNMSVIGNSISNADTGISVISVTNPEIRDNTIQSAATGIYVTGSMYGVFDGNDMTGCSLYFPSNQLIVNLNHTFSNNEVNAKPLFYALNESGLTLDGSAYGEIILANCSDVSVSGGTFSSATAAIELFYTDRVNISNIQVNNNLHPVVAWLCVNLTILDSAFHGGAIDSAINADAETGFMAENIQCQDLLGNGIFVGSYGFRISDSQFKNIGGSGIFVMSSIFGMINNIEVVNATYGVQIRDTPSTLVNGSQFMWNMFAIYAWDASDANNATFNNIHDNQYGIRMDDCFSWHIYNNTVRWNDYGLYITHTDNGQLIYNNTFALNTVYNGYDTGADAWDDHIDGGNYWNDYSGTGTYAVPGGSSVDHYPIWYMVYKPIINNPSDAYYAEGSEGNSITWRPFDNSLRNWVITMDGSDWASGIWNFVDIAVNIDGLSYGTHTAVITVWDVDQNSVSDTVIIHVYDNTAPVVKGPPNLWLFVGATGQTIKWQVSDLNPATYTLTVDDNSFSAGSWTTGTLSINVDGINAVGEHTLVLTIYDVDHNSAQNTVLVKVINDNVSPTIQQPDNVTYVEGTTGNYITWNPSDEYPGSYEVMFNGTAIAEGSWGGSYIVTNVDGLAPGTYEYTLTVYDMSGNSATSSVNVTVTPLIPAIPAGEIDWVLIAIVAAVVGGVVVVVALVYYLRKRR